MPPAEHLPVSPPRPLATLLPLLPSPVIGEATGEELSPAMPPPSSFLLHGRRPTSPSHHRPLPERAAGAVNHRKRNIGAPALPPPPLCRRPPPVPHCHPPCRCFLAAPQPMPPAVKNAGQASHGAGGDSSHGAGQAHWQNLPSRRRPRCPHHRPSPSSFSPLHCPDLPIFVPSHCSQCCRLRHRASHCRLETSSSPPIRDAVVTIHELITGHQPPHGHSKPRATMPEAGDSPQPPTIHRRLPSPSPAKPPTVVPPSSLFSSPQSWPCRRPEPIYHATLPLCRLLCTRSRTTGSFFLLPEGTGFDLCYTSKAKSMYFKTFSKY